MLTILYEKPKLLKQLTRSMLLQSLLSIPLLSTPLHSILRHSILLLHINFESFFHPNCNRKKSLERICQWT